MNLPEPSNEGVSPKVKIFVISLTVLTVAAFSVFFFQLIFKFFPSSKSSAPEKISSQISKTWVHEFQLVGDRLKKAGLKEQAIEQYSEFLKRANIDSITRAQVSETIGELYVELGDCREGLVWFFHAQAAGPDAGRVQGLESQIDACLKEVNPSQP